MTWGWVVDRAGGRVGSADSVPSHCVAATYHEEGSLSKGVEAICVDQTRQGETISRHRRRRFTSSIAATAVARSMLTRILHTARLHSRPPPGMHLRHNFAMKKAKRNK
ncbi:unnamed protein product [Nippostrongylus brasiliensis]|uniref:Uncharacterized protein n=1 Tax=Nippostrongylus brasiliensis TaxID=27835 RepID=A0A0N4YTL9_NIPBR|nr:unnamed protein product [Nippostrongylus brasiliensis]